MFRFSIRDVLWLTVVVGLAVGWASRSGQDSTRYSLDAGSPYGRASESVDQEIEDKEA